MNVKEIKSRLDQIRKEQTKLEKLIAKQEEDELYDNDLYDELDDLEKERLELEDELTKLEY